MAESIWWSVASFNKFSGKVWVALCLQDRYFLIWQTQEIINVFIAFTLKQVFGKAKTLFKKSRDYYFLAKVLRLKKTQHFHKKAVPSKANVQTNKIERTRWTYHKERNSVNNNFIFWKFTYTNMNSWFNVPSTQMSILVLFARIWVFFKGTFSVRVSLTIVILWNTYGWEFLLLLFRWTKFHCSWIHGIWSPGQVSSGLCCDNDSNSVLFDSNHLASS